MQTRSCVKPGEPAPDFSLLNTEKKEWRLADQRGRVLAVLFYPGNETLVCTKQLCSVRDNWSRYMDTGADVIAVSPGTEADNYNFAMHHSLPMPLLSDIGRAVTRTYTKHPILPIWATRGVVIVDADGVVRHRTVMTRAFRPTDDEVIHAINRATYDRLSAVKAQMKFEIDF